MFRYHLTLWVRRQAAAIAVVTLLLLVGRSAWGQITFDRPPIDYFTADVDDPVARLQARIDSGEVELEHEKQQGFLRSVLKELGVSPSSQMLVFSKTSFQQRLISPHSPRALYFNDDVYVGFVQRGDVLEFSSVDAQQGVIFYTLDQNPDEPRRFVRDQGNCMACHASSRTHNVPGHLVRSVYSSPTGMPHFGSGTFRTTQASPLKQRWGGWYVTGTHGSQRHMGNVVSRDKHHPEDLDVEAGANRTSIDDLVRTAAYLTPHSDIVALMVLEHQTEMHNLITRAGYTARTAMYQMANMNEVLGRPNDHVSESVERRINRDAEALVAHMLFIDEIELNDTVCGTSAFAGEFAARGPFDSQGRSLRQFDLDRRLFKYPCSYLIYSEAFDALPEEVRLRVYVRLWEVLTGKDTSEAYEKLSGSDRKAILEIIRDTKENLPDYWQ